MTLPRSLVEVIPDGMMTNGRGERGEEKGERGEEEVREKKEGREEREESPSTISLLVSLSRPLVNHSFVCTSN